VPYKALKSGFHGDLCSSSLPFLPQHLQWQPIPHFPLPRLVCVPPKSSMSPCNLRSCFSCVSSSLYYCINVRYSDFSVENLFVQNVWYPGTGTSPILDTIFTFHFPPSSSNLAAGPQITLNTQVLPNTM
jgi:hypothetical protein